MRNKGNVRSKWLLVLGALALTAGGGWFFLRDHEEPPQFQTATISRGDLTQVVTASGTLNPVLNVQVGSQISGIIQKLLVDFNSPVKAGQIVAQLDPATYQANVHSAEGDLANAKAALEYNQADARRATELLKNNLISQSEHDKIQATLHQSEAQVQIKEASLERARVDLARCTIYAPVDGVVIDRKVDVGQTVAASMSAPVLFQIANDLTKMQINANVSEADVGTVAENLPVNFTVDAFPNRTFLGKVIQIRNAPTTVQNVVTYDTIIEVDNRDLRLKPGMTANVSIITAQRTNTLKLSNAAFRYKPADAATNYLIAATATKTNTPGETPLTGNEPPEELQKRVSELRERGEETPPAIREKLRAYYQSGVLQRPAGFGGGRRSEGGEPRPRTTGTQPSTRTVYVLVGAGDNARIKPVTVKTGINDGAATEILHGLDEGDKVITATTFPNAASQPASNPFGGGMMPRR